MTYEEYAAIRDKLELTDYKVSNGTGIGRSTFSDWKNNRSSPKPKKERAILEYFASVNGKKGMDLSEYINAFAGYPDLIYGEISESLEGYRRMVRRYNKEGKEISKSTIKDIDSLQKGLTEHYISKEVKEMAEFMHKNPEYKVLFDASRKVKPEDISKALKAIGIFIDED